MKIAIVHDYLKEYGGAERVLEALHELYPDAPVYTSVYLPEFLGPHKERFKNWDIRESWARFLPFREKLISPLRIISPLLFRQFDFSDYDVVIVSATGAYAPNSIKCHPEGVKRSKDLDSSPTAQNDKRKGLLHICYCHTPPHYLYGYMTAQEWKKNWVIRAMGEIMNHFLRLVDYKSAQNVDYFIANSQEVQSRIKKFYRRESTVIYPPVEIPSSKSQDTNNPQNTKYQIRNTNYYLTGGRLARAKGIDIILEAFRRNGKQLKVFGRGFVSRSEILLRRRGPNIEYLGEVSDEEKFALMRNAKAFVFASFDEDFGITPVEAMGMGTPVIAYNSGGVKETVVHGKTGVLYNKNTPEELNKAIEQLETLTINSEDCKQQAAKFSKERFLNRIKQFVAKVTT